MSKYDWIAPVIIILFALAAIVWVAADAEGPLAPIFGLDDEEADDPDGAMTGTSTATETTPPAMTTTSTAATTAPGVTTTTTTGAATTTATMTTSTTTTMTTSTTTTATGTSSPGVDHSGVVWPFSQADAQAGKPYSFVGIWPNDAQGPPQGTMDWTTHRIGWWNFTMGSQPRALGNLQVAVEPKSGSAFDQNHLVAELRLFVLNENGELAAAIPHPQDGTAHLPYSHPKRWPDWDYTKYYFGDQERPEGTSPLPWPIILFEDQLVALLTNHYPGEAASLFVPQEGYACSPSAEPGGFFPPCYGDLYITGRLDAIYPGV